MDAEAIHRLATQAKELKEDPAFTAAVLALRKQWFGELMTVHDERAAVHLTMKLQALEEIPSRLQVLINDWSMIKGKQNV